MSTLDGKRILVTGASSGLGRSCAELLAERGASLILVGRDPQRLAGALPSGGHLALECDVTDEARVKAVLAEVKATGTPVDGWVFAAGGQEIRPLITETYATLQKWWAVNVAGTLGFLGAALKSRVVAKGGSIIFFSSAATRAGGAGLANYAATKGALEAAARSLALELAGQKIRVNCVAPGVIPTPMSELYMKRLTTDQRADLERRHPLGLGVPADVAHAIAFLLSDEARWITGETLTIDGGLTAQ